jgi:hypothetical protein
MRSAANRAILNVPMVLTWMVVLNSSSECTFSKSGVASLILEIVFCVGQIPAQLV